MSQFASEIVKSNGNEAISSNQEAKVTFRVTTDRKFVRSRVLVGDLITAKMAFEEKLRERPKFPGPNNRNVPRPRIIDDGAHSDSTSVRNCIRPKIHGFIDAALLAFDDHYSLSLRPQHFWLLIVQAIAQHVNLNSEELRSKWVNHDGSKTLVVQRDDFILGSNNDWANVVSRTSDSFVEQIKAAVVDGAYQDLVPELSNTTLTETICLGVTVMDALQKYFKYVVTTRCGFNEITLEGAESDWVTLRVHAEKLITTRCTADFARPWLRSLLPLLDKFIDEYRKAMQGTEASDEAFWNSMCIRGGRGGSGGKQWLSGWINIFFPYNKSNERNIGSSRHYSDHVSDHNIEGCGEYEYPTGISTAPVVWDYLGRQINLKFKSGFACASQNLETKVISPEVGWFIVTEEAL